MGNSTAQAQGWRWLLDFERAQRFPNSEMQLLQIKRKGFHNHNPKISTELVGWAEKRLTRSNDFRFHCEDGTQERNFVGGSIEIKKRKEGSTSVDVH